MFGHGRAFLLDCLFTWLLTEHKRTACRFCTCTLCPDLGSMGQLTWLPKRGCPAFVYGSDTTTTLRLRRFNDVFHAYDCPNCSIHRKLQPKMRSPDKHEETICCVIVYISGVSKTTTRLFTLHVIMVANTPTPILRLQVVWTKCLWMLWEGLKWYTWSTVRTARQIRSPRLEKIGVTILWTLVWN